MNARVAITLCLALSAAAHTAFAAEQAIGFDPITVKPGEEMRITLFNPSSEPLTFRVFSYSSIDNTYDESPSFTLAPGRMRFFDLKITKDFVGLGGVIEVVPDKAPEIKQAKPALTLTDLLVSSVISRGSLQHRGTSGQTQTMGYSFGATQTNGGWFRTIRNEATRVTESQWIAGPAVY